MIGIWHVVHRSGKTGVIGDLETGFIPLPKPFESARWGDIPFATRAPFRFRTRADKA